MKIKDFNELIFTFQEYGLALDSNLTDDAKRLKKEVRAFVDVLPTPSSSILNKPACSSNDSTSSESSANGE